MIKLEKQKIADIEIIKNNIEEITEYLINSDKQNLISTISMPMLGEVKKNREYSAALKNSEIVLPDGIGIVFLSKLIYGRNSIEKRITGPDFFLFFNKYANNIGLKYFFIGSTEKVLNRIINKLSADFPNIKISGTISPPFGVWDEDTNYEFIKKINTSSPHVLWVAMTAPKQEIWAYKNRDKLDVRIIAPIGAAFDFYAGTKRRAPMFFRKLGFEWAYRIYQEPLRMGKRYLKGFPVYFQYLLKSFIKKRKK